MASTDLKVIERKPVVVAQAEAPSQAQADLDAAVLRIRDCLHRARDADVPAAITEALDCLLPRVLNRLGPRPSDAQHWLIVGAMNKARWPIRDFLNGHLAHEEISRGLDAISALLIHWNEAEAISDARCPDVVPDLRDYAEVFKNQVRNVALLAAIQGRHQWRLDDTVSELHPAFGAEGAA